MNITPEILSEQIKSLTREIREGFKGVHERQDRSNGKLLKHNNDIIDLQKSDIHIENKFKIWKGYWMITGMLVSIILTLLGIYVF
uniref:Uncharacterized protein n=1 Tax=viral metagenome TaxID=1070528 RepID=A0A6M3K361_9ZZZZ